MKMLEGGHSKPASVGSIYGDDDFVREVRNGSYARCVGQDRRTKHRRYGGDGPR
jgi:hypothetical protein